MHLQIHDNELVKKSELWLDLLHSKVFHIRGKTFVEPQVCPPRRSHQISKPLRDKVLRSKLGNTFHLMGQLVGDNDCDPLPV